jgi:hypothetical protein
MAAGAMARLAEFWRKIRNLELALLALARKDDVFWISDS